jgi:cobalt/nickel transport system permease protein
MLENVLPPHRYRAVKNERKFFNMHMSDALISPATGGVMWAASAALIGWSGRKLQKEGNEQRVPLMGVMGAFVFAAQMINFSIPGTGSSGHLGGGLLLAILLGPYAAFITISSVLAVQALFFADGGLLAMGCNIFNLGFFPCFIAYPFIYKYIVGNRATGGRLMFGAVVGAVVGLLMGATAVVLQAIASGVTELNFLPFMGMMLPIHFAIGIVEGLVTAAVATFVWQARPDMLDLQIQTESTSRLSRRMVLASLLAATLLVGGVAAWFASGHPDGLEWSIAQVTGTDELDAPESGVYGSLSKVQAKTAVLPDYGFAESPDAEAAEASGEGWPAVSAGTTTSGLVGGAITLALVALIGLVLTRLRPRQAKSSA